MKKKQQSFHMNHEKQHSMSSMIFFGTPSLQPNSQEQMAYYIQQEEHPVTEEELHTTNIKSE